MFTALEALLARKNQRFLCVRQNESVTEFGATFITCIEHEVRPPLPAEELQEIRSKIGDLPDFIAFYSRFGGLRLYCERVDGPYEYSACGVCITPPSYWPGVKQDFKRWIEDVSEEHGQDVLPDWLKDYVVIGEFPSTGTYIVVPLVGESRGAVFEFFHDGCTFKQRAAGIAEYLALIATPNSRFLSQIAPNYSDGKTTTNWKCKEYLYDE
jgi:hypothetical protein